ncbi:lysophospholipid acyltransferase family protein [Adhaeribacter rhizoryzae]|uniref:Glycerol acyltransferase n=1 Tax=Adhaeribacter rhizoryzae TaxID=2607907 RepID=A0A5M6DTJ0_9BACT|nr:lysophospholipid acyltransferase family protein [Adhaeribacter rhizoryzae]KAA5548735.1 glycerol acyltransferase [Adhaeribacter rhizoryzae]
MFYAFLKIIFKIALRIFFRRIVVSNKSLIPVNGPLLIAANHPNTFMDPIAIAAVIKPEVNFLAKSTLFSTPFYKWLLQRMNLIPVYRREDGVASSGNNNQTFEQCFRFLNQRGTLLIFPEGNSYNERCLRPLKTGTARIALGTLAQEPNGSEVLLLPVGLNYSEPTRFRSDLFINIGEPIRVAAYAQAYQQDPINTVQQLTDYLRHQLEDLLVTVDSPEEDELVARISAIYNTNLAAEFNLSQEQEDQFVLTKAIAESIRYFNQHEPERVRNISKKIHQYALSLKKLGLQDIFLNNTLENTGLRRKSVPAMLFLLLGLPVFCWGLLTNYIPYYIPDKMATVITREEEFRAPIMMTTGIFTFPIYYALLIWAFYSWHNNIGACLLFAVSLPISGLLSLHYSYRLRLTRSYLKFVALFYRRSSLVNNIRRQRQEIIQKLEEAKAIYLQHLTKITSNS